MQIHVPKELAEMEPVLEYFINTMVRKLHANRHKGNGEAHIQNMVAGLKSETNELLEAIKNESQFNVLLEGADVANFAFLIALNAIIKDKASWQGEQNGNT